MLTFKSHPNSGRILLEGRDIDQMLNLNGKIGYCPQEPACVNDLSIENHIRTVYMIRGVGIRESKVATNRCMVSYRCDTLADKPPGSLSGGGKKKLSLAMANPVGFPSGYPKVLMLDEAIAALDMGSQEMVKRYMKRAVDEEKKSVLFSTHYFNEIEDFSEKILVLSRGKVLFFGTIADFYNEFDNMFSVTLRFSQELSGEEKQECIGKILGELDFLEVNDSFDTQVIFNFSDEDNMPILERSTRVLEGLVKLFGDCSHFSSISIGPFDLEQSFSRKYN
jgi:ABC-type multidrug transport system ATPase subunit